eukprot:1145843-Pelagomonas_calceolata.AAC.16
MLEHQRGVYNDLLYTPATAFTDGQNPPGIQFASSYLSSTLSRTHFCAQTQARVLKQTCCPNIPNRLAPAAHHWWPGVTAIPPPPYCWSQHKQACSSIHPQSSNHLAPAARQWWPRVAAHPPHSTAEASLLPWQLPHLWQPALDPSDHWPAGTCAAECCKIECAQEMDQLSQCGK